jgi:hypothetical protein
MKKLFTLIIALLALNCRASTNELTTSTNIQNWVNGVIATNTQAIIGYLLGPGVGRYPHIPENTDNAVVVSGYSMTWALDSEIDIRGIGCCWRFYARKDGLTYELRDGHGPNYKEGVDQPWTKLED